MTTLISTPCATATLNFFGVSGVTWNERTQQNVWEGTLRRAGYAVRSRASKLSKKEQTVGAARQKIAAISEQEPNIKAFVARVDGHVLVIGRDGQTLVDTDPRKNDRRKLKGLVAVM
jgi:hypothetical protein